MRVCGTLRVPSILDGLEDGMAISLPSSQLGLSNGENIII
jgi:hypothetical protein